jgi:hypothetical protein
MDNLLNSFKAKCFTGGAPHKMVASESDILAFESANGILLPDDLKSYFLNINGTHESFTDAFFEFYSLARCKKAVEAYGDWKGIPDYSNLVNTLPDHHRYYCFANYNINMFVYAIQLHQHPGSKNEILVICGDEHRVIAESFTRFIEIYLADPYQLQY